MDAIPVETFTADSVKDPGGAVLSCPVCQDDFAAGESACKLSCKHFFHKECLEPWLKDHNTCPTCREVIPETVTGAFADGDRAGGAGAPDEPSSRAPPRSHRNERSAADMEDEQLRMAMRASLQDERERAAAPSPAEREEADLRAAIEASMRDAPAARPAAAPSSSSSSSSAAAAAVAPPAPSAPAPSAAGAAGPEEEDDDDDDDWEVVALDEDEDDDDPSAAAQRRAAIRASVEEARRVDRALASRSSADSAAAGAAAPAGAVPCAPPPDAAGPDAAEAQRLYEEFLAWDPQDLRAMCRDNSIPLPEDSSHEACARHVAVAIAMVSRAASASEARAPATGSPGSSELPPPPQRARMAGRPEVDSPPRSAAAAAAAPGRSTFRNSSRGPVPAARVPSVLESLPPPPSLAPGTEAPGGGFPVEVELTLPSGRTVTHLFNPVSHLTAIAALAVHHEPEAFDTHPDSRLPLLGLELRSDPAPPRAAMSSADGRMWLAPWAQSFREAGISSVAVAAKRLDRHAFDSMNPLS